MTTDKPLIEQYKAIQIRYAPLQELDQAITKCLEEDWYLNFLPAKENEAITDVQTQLRELSDKLQQQATPLYNKLKKWK